MLLELGPLPVSALRRDVCVCVCVCACVCACVCVCVWRHAKQVQVWRGSHVTAFSLYVSSCQKSGGSGRSQDGGGIGQGDHFLFYKFIQRTTER